MRSVHALQRAFCVHATDVRADPDSENIARTINLIGHKVSQTRFEATDPDSDEVVLMRIAQVLTTAVCQPVGVFLSGSGMTLKQTATLHFASFRVLPRFTLCLRCASRCACAALHAVLALRFTLCLRCASRCPCAVRFTLSLRFALCLC